MIPSAEAIRRLNSYQAVGIHQSRTLERLDRLVLEHLETLRVLDMLPNQSGDVLRLALEGFEQQEIAEMLSISKSQVYRRLKRLRTVQHAASAARFRGAA